VKNMQLKSLNGCLLAIGSYPPFSYDATGGGGEGVITDQTHKGLNYVVFDKKRLRIPSLTYKTTKFLGLPLPPGLEICIKPDKLEGSIDQSNGSVLFQFEARFNFRISNLYKASDLIVKTKLSTGSCISERHNVNGIPLKSDGNALLVGVADVPKSGDIILDRFLGLPNEALAVLNCELNVIE